MRRRRKAEAPASPRAQPAVRIPQAKRRQPPAGPVILALPPAVSSAGLSRPMNPPSSLSSPSKAPPSAPGRPAGAASGAIPLLDDLKAASRPEEIERRLVVKTTSMRAARPSRLRMHRHQYCEVFWYVTGGGTMVTDDGRRSFEAPALIVMGPGRAHTAELRMETEGWLAAFSPELARHEGDAAGAPGAWPLFGTGSCPENVREVRGGESAGEITWLFQKMLREYQGRGRWREQCLRSSLQLLLIKAARLFPDPPAAGGGTAAVITRRFLERVVTRIT